MDLWLYLIHYVKPECSWCMPAIICLALRWHAWHWKGLLLYWYVCFPLHAPFSHFSLLLLALSHGSFWFASPDMDNMFDLWASIFRSYGCQKPMPEIKAQWPLAPSFGLFTHECNLTSLGKIHPSGPLRRSALPSPYPSPWRWRTKPTLTSLGTNSSTTVQGWRAWITPGVGEVGESQTLTNKPSHTFSLHRYLTGLKNYALVRRRLWLWVSWLF